MIAKLPAAEQGIWKAKKRATLAQRTQHTLQGPADPGDSPDPAAELADLDELIATLPAAEQKIWKAKQRALLARLDQGSPGAPPPAKTVKRAKGGKARGRASKVS